MNELSWITGERIAISGIPPIRLMARMAEQGLTHIINRRSRMQDHWSGDLAAEQAAFGPARSRTLPCTITGGGSGPRRGQAEPASPPGCSPSSPQAGMLIHCTEGRHRSVMLTHAVLRLRGHTREQAAALVLTYRTGAELVPAYVRSVEQWITTQTI